MSVAIRCCHSRCQSDHGFDPDRHDADFDQSARMRSARFLKSQQAAVAEPLIGTCLADRIHSLLEFVHWNRYGSRVLIGEQRACFCGLAACSRRISDRLLRTTGQSQHKCQKGDPGSPHGKRPDSSQYGWPESGSSSVDHGSVSLDPGWRAFIPPSVLLARRTDR